MVAESRRPDGRRPARLIEGREERQALNVIPVIVGQQDGRGTLGLAERLAEADDAGAGIEDEHSAGLVVADLDAGRVAAMPDGARRRKGNRAANPPELHPHPAILLRYFLRPASMPTAASAFRADALVLQPRAEAD